MKVKITLTGPGGELDSKVIDVCDELDPAINEAVKALANNQLCPGDTITIVETD